MNKEDLILAIECTCDDSCLSIISKTATSTIVLEDLREKNSDNIENFGGIVPELAARHHEETLPRLLKKLEHYLPKLSSIHYACCPGLPSSLLVGKVFATTLSQLLQIPIFPINHVHAHIFSTWIGRVPSYPFLSLVISGKTTSIFKVSSPKQIQELESARDHGLGNLFEKISKTLKLTRVTGAQVEKIALKWAQQQPRLKNPKASLFPKRSSDIFKKGIIYSGFLTSFKRYHSQHPDVDKGELCFTFQQWIANDLVSWLTLHHDKKMPIHIAGGCARNSYITSWIATHFKEVVVCDPRFCEDNAVMIGNLGLILES